VTPAPSPEAWLATRTADSVGLVTWSTTPPAATTPPAITRPVDRFARERAASPSSEARAVSSGSAQVVLPPHDARQRVDTIPEVTRAWLVM